jgi:hypothetical protein
VIPTGTQAPRSGTWITRDACEQKIVLRSGDPFPGCPLCRKYVVWQLFKPAD